MSKREEHNRHVRVTGPRMYDQCVFKDNNWKICFFVRLQLREQGLYDLFAFGFSIIHFL